MTVIRFLIAIGLTGHTIAHGNALLALARQAAGEMPASSLVVMSWLLPGADATTAAMLAIPFWLLPTAGFLAVALAAWGVVGTAWPWRRIAIAAAALSTAGVTVFSAIWPGGDPGLNVLHIALALAMNTAILGSQVVLHWPIRAVISR